MADASLVFSILAKDETSKGMSSAKKRVIAGMAAVGTAAIGYATVAVKKAMEDQQGQAILAKALRNSTGARASDIASVEKWIQSTTLATGVADDDLRPALATLARATGDTSKAQDQLKLAMDVSAATGKSLSSVTLAMAKAQTGSVGSLSRLGIATKDAKGKTESFAQVYTKMQNQFGGAQAAKAKTAAGQMQILKNAYSEATESVGYGLLPILTSLMTFVSSKLLPPMQSLSNWMSKNSNAAKVLGAVLAVTGGIIVALTVANKVAKVATEAWSAAQKIAAGAQWALNAALDANPIAIVVIAIVALVAVLVVLYNKNKTVRAIIQATWSGIKAAIGAVVSWFANTAWPAIRTAAGYIMGYYKTLWNAVKTVWGGIQNAIGAVVNWFANTAWPKIKTVAGFIKGIWSGIANAGKTAFNAIASAWNNTVGKLSFTIPSWVPLIGGKGFSMPQIPLLAAGGIVTKPTLAMVGEAGPEAVIPLSKMGSRSVTVERGAVQISVHGGEPDKVKAAIDAAFKDLIRQLRTA